MHESLYQMEMKCNILLVLSAVMWSVILSTVQMQSWVQQIVLTSTMKRRRYVEVVDWAEKHRFVMQVRHFCNHVILIWVSYFSYCWPSRRYRQARYDVIRVFRQHTAVSALSSWRYGVISFTSWMLPLVRVRSHSYEYESGYLYTDSSKHEFTCIPIVAVHIDTSSVRVRVTCEFHSYEQFLYRPCFYPTRTM